MTSQGKKRSYQGKVRYFEAKFNKQWLCDCQGFARIVEVNNDDVCVFCGFYAFFNNLESVRKGEDEVVYSLPKLRDVL